MQLKFNYNKKPFETYVSFDPAIDHVNSDIKKFLETRDSSFLKFKPGMTPTKFYLKNIPRWLFIHMMNSDKPSQQILLAFQYGIERIDNLKETFLNEGVEITNNGLTTWEPTAIMESKNGDKIKYIEQEELENAFNLHTIMELGSVVLGKANWVPGTKAIYPVLPTSIEIIEKMKS